MHIRTLLGRDPKTKQLKKKGHPRIPDTEQLHSKATEVTLPHLTSPSYRRREHIEYILHKMQRRVSHVSEPPRQGRWPCHRQDVARTSDHATQGPQSSFLHEATATPHCPPTAHRPFPGPKRTFSPICEHTSAELWVPDLGTSEMGKLDKFCSLTKGSQQFVLPPRFKKKKNAPYYHLH